MARSIDGLPNEILIQILSRLPTSDLLRLAVISPRFSSLIRRILHERLVWATSLPSHKLILEAYHPTNKYSEPYVLCDYLGTPGLKRWAVGDGDGGSNATGEAELYSRLRRLYSKFQPARQISEVTVSSPSPPPDTPNAAIDGIGSNAGEHTGHIDLATSSTAPAEYIVNLDSHELFSQFCIAVNLVKVGPRRGVFLNIMDVEQRVVRVWREWLEKQVQMLRLKRQTKKTKVEKDMVEKENGSKNVGDSNDIGDSGEDTIAKEQASCTSILWTDHRRNVGLVVQVKDQQWRMGDLTGPILMSADEEQQVTYTIEVEEIVVRTTHLAKAVEESVEPQLTDSGGAMIIGSFAASI